VDLNISTIIILAVATLIAAIGLAVGVRLVPIAKRAKQDLAKMPTDSAEVRNKQDLTQIKLLSKPAGRRRDSSIMDIAGDQLRHTDGSYTRAYHVSLNHTIFDETHLIESRIDELARLLASRKPADTVIQFRLSVSPDPGLAVQRHLRSRDEENVHPQASLLHMMGTCFYQDAAMGGAFKRHTLSAWVRVPVKHRNDESRKGLGHFFPTLKRELALRGKFGFLKALAQTLSETTNDRITRRDVNDEKHAIEEADKTFRLFEQQSPLRLKRFTRDELWEAVYLGHRQNANVAPILPKRPGRDVRDYLSLETIAGDGNFVMHGNYPAAVISLFVPPQPYIFADCMRVLTTNAELNFRHTIITDYVYLDQEKARKRLDKRIRQVSRANRSARHGTFEGRKAMGQLSNVREAVTGDTEALVKARFYAVIYSEAATDKAALRSSLKNLDRYCEQLVTAIRRIPGAEAEREEPAALRGVYHRALVGELSNQPTGREILETTDTLATLTPTESAWPGSPQPHTICSTPTGHLTGFNLYDRSLVTSPLVLLIAQPRGGKSVFMCRIINDVLATKANVRVRAVDYGKSLAPLVEVLNGRYLRFDEGTKTINTWDYPGLELGQLPDDLQKTFVVADLMHLSRAEDVIAEDILMALVDEVYKNQVPCNRPGREKHEPRLSHLLALLKATPFKEPAARERSETLRISLESFRDDPWIDAPTHPDFLADSRLDVYEIDSLQNLPERIRQSMAFRIAAHVMRSIGRVNPDGTRSPVLLAFDEMWEVVKHYPLILNVIERAARTGGKENAVTMLASHAYEDFTGTKDVPNPIGISLAKTAGVKLIGKQVGDYSRLIAETGLSPAAHSCIEGIKNVPGQHAQFLAIIGSGQDKITEMLQVDLSPSELWTFTSNPDERNARARVQNLRPSWPMAGAIAWLAERYPRGLTAVGLDEIDETELTTAAVQAA
jgi:hypothetical protein